MKTDKFWAIIDATAVAAGGDVDQQAELLTDRLTELGVETVLAFDEAYTAASHALYSWVVWQAADVMIGDASEDVFADFRSWVISRGRATYEAVLAAPDAGLAAIELEDEEDVGSAELFGAASGVAYERLTGVAIYDAFPHRPNADFPTGEPRGPQVGGSRSDRQKLYPQLSKKYGRRFQIRFPWRD